MCETGEFVSIQKPHSLCQEPQTCRKAETSVEERLFLEVKVPDVYREHGYKRSFEAFAR